MSPRMTRITRMGNVFAMLLVVGLVVGRAAPAGAQVGKSQGVVDANTATEADLLKMPHMTPAIVKVISSATSPLKPRLTKRCCSSGAIPPCPVQIWPCERPSKLTVPTIVHSSATVPAPASSAGAPDSGGRT